MNIRLWDFGCKCGKTYRGTPVTAEKIPKTIKCECGKRAGWISSKHNHIHETNSALGYGKFDPQFGCVVESYSHKKQLMREMGLMETKHYTLEEIKEEQWEGERAQREAPDPGIISADELEEVYAQIGKQAHGVRKGALQESWVEL